MALNSPYKRSKIIKETSFIIFFPPSERFKIFFFLFKQISLIYYIKDNELNNSK